MREFCCSAMNGSVQVLVGGEFTARERPIGYDPVFDEYLVSGAATSPSPPLTHCPWCDAALPASRRSAWFERLDQLGLTPDDELPPEMLSDRWWASSGRDGVVTHRTGPTPPHGGSGSRDGDRGRRRPRLGLLAATLAVALPLTVATMRSTDARAGVGDTISGTVTDTDGSPIEGIDVWLCRDSGSCIVPSTDAAGNYSLSNYANDTYRFRFFDGRDPDVFATQHYDGTPFGTPVFADAVPVDLTGGGDFVLDAVMERRPVVSGTVTDNFGTPIPGIYVQVARQGGCCGVELTTDADGGFSSAVDAGDYTVSYNLFDRNHAYSFEWWEDSEDHASRTIVQLANEDALVADADLYTFASISGTVTDEAGTPIEGVNTYLCEPVLGCGWNTATGADGTFTTVLLRAGDWTIAFRSDDWVDEWWEDDQTSSGNFATPITLTEAQDYTLPATIELGGTGGISGLVADEAMVPIEGARVGVTRTDAFGGRSVETAADGTYSVTGLTPGDYIVSYEATGHFDEWYDDSLDLAGAQTLVVGTTTLIGIDANLTPSGQLAGTVTDSTGTPLEFVRVSVCAAIGDCEQDMTDAAGEYIVDGLVSADYSVGFNDLNGVYPFVWHDGAAALEDATPVAVSAPDTTTLDVTLQLAGSVAGTVTGAGVGPLADITVRLCRPDGHHFGCDVATTGADGTYLVDGVLPGTYQVEFTDGQQDWAPEFFDDAFSAATATPIVVAADVETTGIDAELEPGGVIEGRTTDVDGDGLFPSQVEIEVCSESRDFCATTFPQSAGVIGFWRVRGLPAADDYIVKFEDAVGEQTRVTEWWCDTEDDASALPISLGAGETVRDIDASTRLIGAADHDSCDQDGDEVFDPVDNCVDDANADQADADRDGLGDVCDSSDGREVMASLTPARFADSRNEPTLDGRFRNTGIRRGGTTWEIQIAGRGGVPADASAAVLNITAVGGTGPGFATVHPCGSLPTTSSVNYLAGGVDPNEVIAKLSQTGTVCVYVLTDVHVIVDVVGHVTDSPYVALTPARYADSRNEPTFDGAFRNVGIRRAGSVWEIEVAGRGDVPADAAAAVINLTVTGASRDGFATVFPCRSARPLASSLNYGPGETRPNELVASIGFEGKVCVYVFDDVHVIADVVGYIGAEAKNYAALNPARFADSRDEPTFDDQQRNTGIRGAGTTWEIPIAGRGQVPSGATSAVINLTVTGGTAPGFATVHPCGTLPTASSINYGPGTTRPNELVAKLSPTGTICVYTLSPTHVIIDVVGHG